MFTPIGLKAGPLERMSYLPKMPEPLFSVWSLEGAEIAFQHCLRACLVLCIKPESKEVKWTSCLKEAVEFYEEDSKERREND